VSLAAKVLPFNSRAKEVVVAVGAMLPSALRKAPFTNGINRPLLGEDEKLLRGAWERPLIYGALPASRAYIRSAAAEAPRDLRSSAPDDNQRA
jgi:hypothetical protein